MTNEYIEQFSKYGQNTFESLKALAEINQRTAEKLFAKQSEIISTSVETSVEQMKQLTGMKDYKAFFASQSEFTKENSDTAMKYGKEITKIFEEAKEDLTGWVEQNVSAAESFAEKTSKAVKKAA